MKIEFESTSVSERKAKKKLGYELPEGNRIFTRKAQFQYGWDWGPKINTSGIWKDIYIKAWNDAIIEDIYIQSNLAKKKAILDFFATSQITITSSTEGKAKILARVDSISLTQKIILKKGTHNYFIWTKIPDAKRWYPHNIGEPHLYNFEFDLVLDEKTVDRKTVKHGMRTIELVTEKDSIGESFYFKVNDIPVYAKGANYIPQNSFQNNVTDQHYENLLNDVVDANMNMLRVWGGGIYENDKFYELCDTKGILVWQDFMFACAMYPGDKQFLENVTARSYRSGKTITKSCEYCFMGRKQRKF